MNYIAIISAVVGLLMSGIIIYLLARSKKEKPDEGLAILHQRLDSMVQQMSARLDAVGHQVGQQLAESRHSTQQATQSVFQQVQSFTRGMTELQESVRQVRDSVKDVSSFQEMFRSPKLRGSWGELSLEAILQEYFPQGGYEIQHSFKSGEIVDAVLKLPSGQLLPIDSKFNWDNFQKMTEAQEAPARAAYRKQFLSDVKKKVDEIATKYVIPAEDTTDLALMYMPAEAIYYEVIQNLKDEDVAEYARKRKVLLTSPNTLYITLTAVLHWYKDAQVQKQTKQLMRKVEEVIRDAGVLEKDFEKLGGHLDDARSAFERSEKKLGLMAERAQKVIELGQEEVEKLEAPK